MIVWLNVEVVMYTTTLAKERERERGKGNIHAWSLFASCVHCFEAECVLPTPTITTIDPLSNTSEGELRRAEKGYVECSPCSDASIAVSFAVSGSAASFSACRSRVVDVASDLVLAGGGGGVETAGEIAAGEFRCCCCCCSNSYSLIKRFFNG